MTAPGVGVLLLISQPFPRFISCISVNCYSNANGGQVSKLQPTLSEGYLALYLHSWSEMFDLALKFLMGKRKDRVATYIDD